MKSLFHWNYFLSIENDFVELARYVDFSSENWRCFSIEISRLHQSCCSEVEAVLRHVCESCEGHNLDKLFGDLHFYVEKYIPRIKKFSVQMPLHGLHFTPFSKWTSAAAPQWWSDHNKVKHRRSEHFVRGNLENALNALAALYVANIYLYRDGSSCGPLYPNASLLVPESEHDGGFTMTDNGLGRCFNLVQ